MIQVIHKPSFKKAYKKLHLKEKEVVDTAINAIVDNPNLGDSKKGELSGLLVYKFKINKQQKLLAYTYDEENIMLINIGAHENFYRDLKKSL